ncbi:MAG TPA: Lpg1974 family pore-forming outer membrane protein, partial [Caulobacteraceae bacterium]|nr:Lpg1974 family pore-forming outer membrane protein [Caulobacteraceae bacterium]
YAQFESRTRSELNGIPNWDIVGGWHQAFGSKYPSNAYIYDAELEALREFSGTGPVVTWAAALPVLGSENSGRLALDWSVSAGVLFGRQETTVSGSEYVGYFEGRYLFDVPRALEPVFDSSPGISRSSDVTAPLVDLSLGLSYGIGRINVGAGYRWERYFDVLDVGHDEAKDADRTIDGPYFKIAVGFGG